MLVTPSLAELASLSLRPIQRSCLTSEASSQMSHRVKMMGLPDRGWHEKPTTCPAIASNDTSGLRRYRVDSTRKACEPGSTGISTVRSLEIEPTAFPSISTFHIRARSEWLDTMPVRESLKVAVAAISLSLTQPMSVSADSPWLAMPKVDTVKNGESESHWLLQRQNSLYEIWPSSIFGESIGKLRPRVLSHSAYRFAYKSQPVVVQITALLLRRGSTQPGRGK